MLGGGREVDGAKARPGPSRMETGWMGLGNGSGKPACSTTALGAWEEAPATPDPAVPLGEGEQDGREGIFQLGNLDGSRPELG